MKCAGFGMTAPNLHYHSLVGFALIPGSSVERNCSGISMKSMAVYSVIGMPTSLYLL